MFLILLALPVAISSKTDGNGRTIIDGTGSGGHDGGVASTPMLRHRHLNLSPSQRVRFDPGADGDSNNHRDESLAEVSGRERGCIPVYDEV